MGLLSKVVITGAIIAGKKVADKIKEVKETSFKRTIEGEMKNSKTVENKSFIDTSTDFEYCPHCGAMNSSNAKFCEDCGKPIVKTLFCQSCGAKLNENAKFCNACGHLVVIKGIENQRGDDFEYVGATQRCKHCGEIISSHTTECPSCHMEIRGAKSSLVVKEFFRLLQNKHGYDKIDFIREYPLPSSREDLLEFSMQAKSQILCNDIDSDGKLNAYEKSLSMAWKTKFEQYYTKAKMLLGAEDVKKLDELKYEIEIDEKKRRKMWRKK